MTGQTGDQYFALLLSEALEDDPPMILSTMTFSVQHHLNSSAAVQSALLTSCEREEHPKQSGFAEHLEEKSNYDFFRNLRVTKETFAFILDKFKSEYNPKHSGGYEPVSTKTSLYMTLWYLGNQDSYREIAELFGMSEAAVHKCVQRGIIVLCNMGPDYIKWPSNEEIPDVVEKFKSKSGFPGVVGAVDGCHIKIKAPDDVQSDFIDRTSSHSVNLMAVCDSEKRFTFVDAGYPGSAHDSTVFKETPIYKRLTNNPGSVIPSNYYHIIGDSAFQLTPFMLVPFKDYGHLEVIQSRYNKKLSQTRYVIENAFGLLKGRFRRLKYLDVDVDKFPYIILACCVFHNITLGNQHEEDFLMADGCVIPPIQYENLAEAFDLPAETGGGEKRDFVASML